MGKINSINTKVYVFVILCLLMPMYGNKEGQKQDPIQILGFQSWQQPTQEQIKIQFKKLTQQYKYNKNQDAQIQYKKIVEAFQIIRKNKFTTAQNNGFKDAFHTNNFARQGRKPRSSGFYSYKSTYKPNYEFEDRKLKLDIDDLLRDFNFDFIHLNTDKQSDGGNQNFQTLSFDVSAKQFFIWLLNNPAILIAAVLISFGLFNLCTCCCCCCCSKCCRRKKEKKKMKQVQIKKNGNFEEFRQKINKRKQAYKIVDDKDGGYHSN